LQPNSKLPAINCRYFQVFRRNPFPKVPSSVIRAIRERVEDPAAIIELLYDIDFCFPLITQTVTEIASEAPFQNPNNQHYANVFLLVSYASWFVNFIRTGRTSTADVVLRSVL
jgi:hypothetical protein